MVAGVIEMYSVCLFIAPVRSRYEWLYTMMMIIRSATSSSFPTQNEALRGFAARHCPSRQSEAAVSALGDFQFVDDRCGYRRLKTNLPDCPL